MTNILGISAFYHDSAACLVKDGNILSAAQEERFSRVKHDHRFPKNSIDFILKSNELTISDIDRIIFFEKPFLKFERLVETYLAFAPYGFQSFSKSMPLWVKDKLFQKNLISKNLKYFDSKINFEEKILFSEHHLSHAASAFYPSPFEEAIILTADGVGEWATTSVAIGKNNKIKIEKEIHFPHSLGLLYSAFTYYTGFKVNSGEYKLMGLAPYGNPIYVDTILKNLIDIKEDGSFRMDQKFFNYSTGLTMTNDKFNNLFGQKARDPKKDQINQFHMDIAASIQKVTETIMIKICKSIKKEYHIDNLCLAGGVALNCVANGKVLKQNIFKNIWIQPAAGDAGGSLGAALIYWYQELNNQRHINKKSDSMKGSFLGPFYSHKEIEHDLNKVGAIFEIYTEEEIINQTAKDIANNLAIGWFQGKMEFGPRALGCRSILGNPMSSEMQKNLNLKVKFRESFRPFAPSVLREDLNQWFELNVDSPFMLLVSEVKENIKVEMTTDEKKLFGIDKLNIVRSKIPSVTHVDYSSRIQTVDKETNEIYYRLIKKFKELTGCGVLINTSFNVRGEPIVNTPIDAFNCFMGTHLDRLVIGNCYLVKEKQNKELIKEYKDQFELD